MSKNKTVNQTVSKWVLSARSETRMLGVHEDLKKVVRLALSYSPYDFGITSGSRTTEQQYQLFLDKKSNCDGTNLVSRHQTGHAIDFVVYDENGKVTWDMKYYKAVADAFKRAAEELNIPITWGGDWATLQDGPHIELKQGVYA
ncbi:M15 family metallopeptidase [Vibrio sp. HN007]|uniref:M15 family metallopeptidase n=1 Tax=Vibrio iocasae TaxID=3098914 RepID=UPI0035D43A19